MKKIIILPVQSEEGLNQIFTKRDKIEHAK